MDQVLFDQYGLSINKNRWCFKFAGPIIFYLVKESVSQDISGFFWHVWIDLVLNKCRGWFLNFFAYLGLDLTRKLTQSHRSQPHLKHNFKKVPHWKRSYYS